MSDSPLDPKRCIDIARLLPGPTIHPLEPESTPVEAFVLVTLLGAPTVHVALLTDELRDEWLPD